MEFINFSFNWNNKLNNLVFTTIRAHSKTKYELNKEYQLMLHNHVFAQGIIIGIVTKNYLQLSDGECFLDTGYSLIETRNIIKTMYKLESEKSFVIDYILIKKTKALYGIIPNLITIKETK